MNTISTRRGEQSLVNRFAKTRGKELDPRDANGRLLSAAVAYSSADIPHDGSDQSSGIMQRKMEELDAARKKFSSLLNQQQRHQIADANNTTDAILNIVDNASLGWMQRSEQHPGACAAFRRGFHKTCEALDQHQELLKMIPNGSEYVSVFFGTMTTIVRASVNHQAMAKGLPKIMEEVNIIVRSIRKMLSLYPSARQEIATVVLEAYIKVFDLYTKIMDWFTSKRHFLKLLRDDCYTRFESDIAGLRTWAKYVAENMTIEMAWENRESFEMLNRSSQMRMEKIMEIAERYSAQQKQQAVQMKLAIQESADRASEMAYERFVQNFLLMGSTQKDTLAMMHRGIEADASAVDQAIMDATATSSTPFLLLPCIPGNPVTNDKAQSRVLDVEKEVKAESTQAVDLGSRDSILANSQNLDDWFPAGQLLLGYQPSIPVLKPNIPEGSMARLTAWITSKSSELLCMQWSDIPGREPQSTATAAYVVAAAAKAEYPTISYSCSLPRGPVPEGRTPQTMALCEMMGALIRQLVVLLPPEVSYTHHVDLSQDRFKQLDGTLRTWTGTMRVFNDLLLLAPTTLLVILDDLQWLDSEHTYSPVRQVLDSLSRCMARVGKGHGGTKVLLTTLGQARSVVPRLRPEEYVIVEQRRVGSW